MKIIKTIPYILIMATAFYILPNFVADQGMSIMLLISITPPICFITSAVYGAQNKKLDIIFLALVAAVFLSSIFTRGFSVSFLSILLFWILTVIGTCVGVVFAKQKS